MRPLGPPAAPEGLPYEPVAGPEPAPAPAPAPVDREPKTKFAYPDPEFLAEVRRIRGGTRLVNNGEADA